MRRRRDNELSKALQLSMVEGELASEPGPAFKKVKKAYRPLGVGIKTADADEDVGPFATNKPTSSISTMIDSLSSSVASRSYAPPQRPDPPPQRPDTPPKRPDAPPQRPDAPPTPIDVLPASSAPETFNTPAPTLPAPMPPHPMMPPPQPRALSPVKEVPSYVSYPSTATVPPLQSTSASDEEAQEDCFSPEPPKKAMKPIDGDLYDAISLFFCNAYKQKIDVLESKCAHRDNQLERFASQVERKDEELHNIRTEAESKLTAAKNGADETELKLAAAKSSIDKWKKKASEANKRLATFRALLAPSAEDAESGED